MPEDTEDLELLASGRVRAVIDDKTYLLRRPTMGQLRSLREGLTDLAEEAAEMVRVRHPMVVLDAEPDADDERKAAVHAAWRQANVDYTDHIVAWVRQALDTLAEPKLNGLSNDDLPAWAGEQDVANALYKHWRERPFSSGGQ